MAPAPGPGAGRVCCSDFLVRNAIYTVTLTVAGLSTSTVPVTVTVTVATVTHRRCHGDRDHDAGSRRGPW
jgi:hypothetical protein